MVELVIVLPIFLLVLFGIVELSRAWYTLQLATAAVREGVRAAAVAPPLNVETVGESRIVTVLAAGGVVDPCPSPPDNRSCTADKEVLLRPIGIPASTDSEVVANVTVRFRTVFPLLIPRLQQVDISQSAAMRHEGE